MSWSQAERKLFEDLQHEVSDMRDDIRTLLEFRWKLYGISLVVGAMTGTIMGAVVTFALRTIPK